MSTVYVGNLDFDANSGDLRREFDRYGRLRDVWVARRPPGFAFVEFEDRRDAEDAVRDMDGRYILNKRIRAEISRRGGARNDRGGGDRNPRGPPQRTPHRIKITGLPDNASWKELKDMFRRDTEPVYVDLRGRGTAVAEFAEAGDVGRAIELFDDTKIMGSYIRIERDETDGNEGPTVGSEYLAPHAVEATGPVHALEGETTETAPGAVTGTPVEEDRLLQNRAEDAHHLALAPVRRREETEATPVQRLTEVIETTPGALLLLSRP
eukprot:CAMPEP_0185042206 /NCGR_PEP_ID=MMETSP1103-20130426/42215_1 /TAXON_ID=36769 /ORGANISM="Paraphysomonas bandaiensis, Strain Caron Lab Isolate" /LENGTH=265 /DNA_ID=CAMNT_0027582233 /DNA_START=42 /DNA_END=840 /DNA_ORIENTATION=+